jgi:hypothetical protein
MITIFPALLYHGPQKQSTPLQCSLYAVSLSFCPMETKAVFRLYMTDQGLQIFPERTAQIGTPQGIFDRRL